MINLEVNFFSVEIPKRKRKKVNNNFFSLPLSFLVSFFLLFSFGAIDNACNQAKMVP
jgi:hypothetical protein